MHWHGLAMRVSQPPPLHTACLLPGFSSTLYDGSVRTHSGSFHQLWCFHLFLPFSLLFLFLLCALGRDNMKQRVFQWNKVRISQGRAGGVPRALRLRGTAWAQQPEPVWNPALFWAMFNSGAQTCLSEPFLFLVDLASQIWSFNLRI